MNAQEHFDRGNECFNQNDFDGAIAEFSEAFRLDPNRSAAKNNLCAAYQNRGIARFQQKDGDGAVADLTEALALNPDDAQLYGARGFIYSQIGNYDGVINDFTKLIEIAPTADAYRVRAGAYMNKAREALPLEDESIFFKYKDLQIKDLETSLQIDPSDADIQKILKLAKDERKLRKETSDYIEEIPKIFGNGQG